MTGNFKMLFAAILLLSVEFTVASLCNSETSSECERRYQSMLQEKTIFVSKEILMQNCSDILENIRCLEDVIRSCNREKLDTYLMFSNPVQEVIENLCTEDSPLRTTYFKHESCLRNVMWTPEMHHCRESIEGSLVRQIHKAFMKINSAEEVRAFACLVYNPLKFCLKKITTENCGEEASDLVAAVVDRVTEIPRHKLCKKSILSTFQDVVNNAFMNKE